MEGCARSWLPRPVSFRPGAHPDSKLPIHGVHPSMLCCSSLDSETGEGSLDQHAAPTHLLRTRSPASRPGAPRPPVPTRPRQPPSPPRHRVAKPSCIPRPQIFLAFFSPRLVTSHHRRHHHQKNHRNKFHPDASASLLYATQQGDRVLSSFACSAKSMCHPGRPPLPPGCAVIRRRERQQAGVSPSTSAGPTRAHHYCVCSPTAHRGSFRCRWHRVGYEWGRRRPFAREGGATTARAGAEQAMYERMPAP